jgi:hypothetical protein
VFISTRTLLAVKVMFGVVATWAVAHALAVIFICTPVSFQWDLTIIGGKCGDQIKLFQSIITSNIITDVMIMLLPIYSMYPAYLFAKSSSLTTRIAVWHLKMRMTEKVAVTACFLIGIL